MSLVYYMLFFIFQKLIGIILLLMYLPIDTTVVVDSILRMMDLRAAITVRTGEAKNTSLALSKNVIIIALPSMLEKFEDTKGVIRNWRRPYNTIQWPNETDKKTNIDLQNKSRFQVVTIDGWNNSVIYYYFKYRFVIHQQVYYLAALRFFMACVQTCSKCAFLHQEFLIELLNKVKWHQIET